MRQKRSDLLLAFLGYLIFTFALNPFKAHAQQTEHLPPNIVVLVSDDQRWDALGAAGDDIIHTPRLDQLAEDGLNVTLIENRD